MRPEVVLRVFFQIDLKQAVIFLHYRVRGHRRGVAAYFLEGPFVVASGDRNQAHIEDAVVQFVGDRRAAEHRPGRLVHKVHNVIHRRVPVRALVGRDYVDFLVLLVRQGETQDVHGTDVTGVAELPEGTEMVMPGDNVALVVNLITPIAMDEGLRFAIREGGRTVGAGVVTKILV